MAAKKEDFQKEFAKVLEQAKDRFKQFGKEVSVLAKKSEKEIVKASKAGKIQLDIVSLNMQKEKLYYDVGKKVVSLKHSKKGLDVPGLDTFWKKLKKLEGDSRKKKKELKTVRKEKSKK